jgi:hypothetical protein
MSSARSSPIRRLAIALLVTLNAGLTWMLWSTAVDPAPALSREAPAEWSPPVARDAAQGFVARPLESFGQTLARPVFFKSRKPFVAAIQPPVLPAPLMPPPPLPAPPPQPPPEFRAQGILIVTEGRKALIMSKLQPLGAWVAQGEKIEGWTVEAIEPEWVRVRRGDGVIRLDLHK